MAKLGKVKFNSEGKVLKNTTDRGPLTLILHYDNRKDLFYFEYKDLTDQIELSTPMGSSGFHSMFKGCDTKAKAVSIVEVLLEKNMPCERYIALRIGVNMLDINRTDLDNQFMRECVFNVTNYNGSSSGISNDTFSALTMSVVKVLKYTSITTGMVIYAHTDKDWKKKDDKLTVRIDNPYHNRLMIPWTKEREEYIDSMSNNLLTISQKLLEFISKGMDGNSFTDFIDKQQMPTMLK